ncbi:MAG TPA: PD-(D/E)XK nuclease family protein [Candidatus Megaira endosymbiont of Nemacystus decipiens]|nr:PD-(D/E)XK nuclease family protein [Candidatus Megaera endosymbiont of Nemacystus decipiens]
MQIYTTSCKQNFLDEVANIIIKEHKARLKSVKIILPSGMACSKLQHILVCKLGATILPRIISANEMSFDAGEIFTIPSTQIGSITSLEERIVLAQIIQEYQGLDYNQLQSLRLSSSLANLFSEFESFKVDINALGDTALLNKAEHWIQIHKFIDQIYSLWKEKIHKLKKITKTEYQSKVLDSEISWLNSSSDNILILAGITNGNSIVTNFLKKLLKFDNCEIVLPPFPEINAENQYMPSIYNLFKKEKIIKNERQTSPVDSLVFKEKIAVCNDSFITYSEFDNVFQEAQYIATKCKEYLLKEPNNNIAIILTSYAMKEHYSLYLDKHCLSYRDQLGHDITKSAAISFILLLANLLYTPFTLKKFFALLSHPLIANEASLSLKSFIRKNNRFLSSLDEIEKSILELGSDNELETYFNSLKQHLVVKLESDNFCSMLEPVLVSAQKLVPDIWREFPEVVDALKELYNLEIDFPIDNKEDFAEILKQTLTGGRFFSLTPNTQITIVRPSSTSLINFDLVIIPDLNEGSYPNVNKPSPWISKDQQEKLGMITPQDKFNELFYEFYLNLQNKNVLITRSKKDFDNKNTLPSPFILSLQKALGQSVLNKKILWGSSEKCVSPKILANSKFFPSLIYATDVELLIKAPYNFYAKKILKLRKTEEISDSANLADFGNFIHLVFEEYTKNYNTLLKNQIEEVASLADKLITNINATSQDKKIWKIKINAMLEDIVDFEQKRRKTAARVFTEIKGSIKLTVLGKEVEIAAIADRIEIDSVGGARILDYKTGQLPSKQDVLSGIAPQMIIEAIILQENGFDLGKSSNHIVEEIVYVKINSKPPYITENPIALTDNDIKRHKYGLISLLEHYIKSGEYCLEQCDVKYDDYQHLRR